MKVTTIRNQEALDWSQQGDRIALRAAGKTDHFVDPAGQYVSCSAPVLFFEAPQGDFSCEVTVTGDFTTRFDAAGFFLRCGRDWDLKFVLERTPTRELLVVSVLTTEFSDDCCGPEAGSTAKLRVSKIGATIALHVLVEDLGWRLVRYCRLPEPSILEIGLTAQSPLGSQAEASFGGLAFADSVPADIRSGS